MPDYLIELGFGLLIGAISYFLKDFKAKLDKADEILQKQIDSVKDDLHQFQLEVSDRFVLKDDFVRASAITDRKLDKIYDEVIKLSKKKSEES